MVFPGIRGVAGVFSETVYWTVRGQVESGWKIRGTNEFLIFQGGSECGMVGEGGLLDKLIHPFI